MKTVVVNYSLRRNQLAASPWNARGLIYSRKPCRGNLPPTFSRITTSVRCDDERRVCDKRGREGAGKQRVISKSPDLNFCVWKSNSNAESADSLRFRVFA